jgi:hypothetical protein
VRARSFVCVIQRPRVEDADNVKFEKFLDEDRHYHFWVLTPSKRCQVRLCGPE